MREIPLTQGRVAVVSDEDFEELSQHKCQFTANARRHGRGYATRFVNDRPVYMHRVILDAPKGVQVDHIDGDRLNNTRENLRLATLKENRRNNGAYVCNKSGYKGVTWHKKAGKWVAGITVDNKRVYLGLHSDPRDAARAYNEAAKVHFGEFAKLNDID
jgi:hypothetical protein